MSVEVGGWLSLIGFVGLCLCIGGWNKSEHGSTLETLSAVGVLVSAVAAVAMVFQGFHLWNTGWDMDLTQMDPGVAGRAAARGRGKGGIILLAIQFFPQFLVFGYGAVLWQASWAIRDAAKHLGLLKTKATAEQMKPTISIALITLGLTFPAPALAGAFQPFAALSRGSDCRIVLDFPNGEFCGETVPFDSVRSWYFGDGSTVGNETDMLMGQKYDFGIVVNADAGPKVIPIRFLNPGTAKRFHVQMGAWTGKPSATGTDSPFPNWLKLAR